MDCSYEGDLMAKAGVSYHVGRSRIIPMVKRLTECNCWMVISFQMV
ncbi:FAD-dependent oxidoreductase [Sphingobacterium sp. E70]|nr:FAD-dependent oxidoreductase [Sphingobacterium sp. E70]